MITSIEIKGLRGIREGKLADLSRLVVLVGPNGSGKSTILEGILIAASPRTAEAIVQVSLRHEAGGGPRWLLWRAGNREETEVWVRTESGAYRKCRLALQQGSSDAETLTNFRFEQTGAVLVKNGMGSVRAIGNKYVSHNSAGFVPLDDLSEVHLAEGCHANLQKPLHELYSTAVQFGRRNEAIAIVSDIFPGVTNVEILTEHGEPILHFVFSDYSVPASLAGNGILSLLRLSLELAASGCGVALLEEPEVHQHPGAIRQSARAILAAVRRGIQVVLTTHSLELIDALVSESSEEDLEQMSLYRLQLQDGTLTSSRLAGADVAFSRTEIEDDLR